MNRTIQGRVSYTRASAVSSDEIFVACSPDEDDHGFPFTRIGHWKHGRWACHDVNFWTASILAQGPAEAVVLGEKGQIVMFPDLTSITTVVDLDASKPPDAPRLGNLTSLRSIGGRFYATGDGGQVYVQSNSIWGLLDPSLLDGPRRKAPSIFELETDEYMRRLRTEASLTLWNLAGTSETDIYVCGGRGNIERALLHWNGERFASLLPPRDRPDDYTSSLSRLLIESEDRVWACGQRSALLVGNARDGFVEDPVADEYDTIFYDMAMYEGKLHIAGLQDIYRHDGDRLRPLRIGVKRFDRGAHTIQEKDGVLWAVSPKDILRYDGTSWERISYPGND